MLDKKKQEKVVKFVAGCRGTRWRRYSLLPFPLSWGVDGTESMPLSSRVARERNWELGDSGTGSKDCWGLRKGEGAKVGCWVGSQE